MLESGCKRSPMPLKRIWAEETILVLDGLGGNPAVHAADGKMTSASTVTAPGAYTNSILNQSG